MALKMTSLHYQYSGLILTLASQAMTNGYPINRPLWWIDPTDPVAQTIDSGNSRATVLFPFSFFKFSRQKIVICRVTIVYSVVRYSGGTQKKIRGRTRHYFEIERALPRCSFDAQHLDLFVKMADNTAKRSIALISEAKLIAPPEQMFIVTKGLRYKYTERNACLPAT